MLAEAKDEDNKNLDIFGIVSTQLKKIKKLKDISAPRCVKMTMHLTTDTTVVPIWSEQPHSKHHSIHKTKVQGEGNLSLAVERRENECVDMMIRDLKMVRSVIQVSTMSVEIVQQSSKKGNSDWCDIREMRARTMTTRGTTRSEVNTL